MSRHPARSRCRLPALALVAAFSLTACGNGDGADGDAASDEALTVVGQDDLTWDVEELAAEAGTLEFELVCENVNHNLVIDELGEEVGACGPNETVTGSIELDEGDYTYVCTVPGHEQTMRGELSLS